MGRQGGISPEEPDAQGRQGGQCQHGSDQFDHQGASSPVRGKGVSAYPSIIPPGGGKRNRARRAGMLRRARDMGEERSYSPLTNRARMAFKTARIMTPTSANTASHMLAKPRATRARQISLMPMAKMMFW